jgi:two-component system CheB/CheR fusion protein
MEAVGVDTFPAYVDYLELHPAEFPQLFNLLLINVTGFFRDPAAWQAVGWQLPSLVESGSDEQIRMWSAGCSSGEEPYTLAMVAAEALGVDTVLRRVKIFATDVDEEALTYARRATYSAKAIESVPTRLFEKYFLKVGSSYVFNHDLRRLVVFGLHDLVQDAPISRVDLLACRNTLMYFNANAQAEILKRLRFALKPTGLLCLGRAEMLEPHSDLFAAVDLKLRLFSRAAKSCPSRGSGAFRSEEVRRRSSPLTQGDAHSYFEAAFDANPTAQFVVEPGGTIALSNQRGSRLFRLSNKDIRRSFENLEFSNLSALLRASIERVRNEQRAIHLKEIAHKGTGRETAYLDVEIAPLTNAAVLVSFVDVTHGRRLQGELRHTLIEREAAVEQLHSTIEELETTNEELQSTNDELETTNEELHSANEELETINDEIRRRSTELDEINAYHEAVIGSLRQSIAVLDDNLGVLTWSTKMEDLWGPRFAEVEGKNFLDLDMGLPLASLGVSLRSCLESGKEIEDLVECTNRRGKTLKCKVVVTPLRAPRAGVTNTLSERAPSRGVVIAIEEAR